MRLYFSAIQEKDFEKALSFYGDQFFESTPRVEWGQNLKSISAKLGDLQKYDLSEWRVRAKTGTGLAGVFIEMHYKVIYSRYAADEVLTLFKPIGGNEWKILKHQINSPGFIK